jgi:hypothetical protein
MFESLMAEIISNMGQMCDPRNLNKFLSKTASNILCVPVLIAMKSPYANSVFPGIHNFLHDMRECLNKGISFTSQTWQEETDPSLRIHSIITLPLPIITILSCKLDFTNLEHFE